MNRSTALALVLLLVILFAPVLFAPPTDDFVPLPRTPARSSNPQFGDAQPPHRHSIGYGHTSAAGASVVLDDVGSGDCGAYASYIGAALWALEGRGWIEVGLHICGEAQVAHQPAPDRYVYWGWDDGSDVNQGYRPLGEMEIPVDHRGPITVSIERRSAGWDVLVDGQTPRCASMCHTAVQDSLSGVGATITTVEVGLEVHANRWPLPGADEWAEVPRARALTTSVRPTEGAAWEPLRLSGWSVDDRSDPEYRSARARNAGAVVPGTEPQMPKVRGEFVPTDRWATGSDGWSFCAC